MAVGIKETLEVIDFGLALAGMGVNALKDGEVTGADVQFVFPVVMTVMPAFTDISLVAAELSDLEDEELLQIRDHILRGLPTLGDKWAVVATESLKIGLSAFQIIKAFK